jgi:uncharacterized SAM-binding protein YcdF (DUF218 family)
LTVLNVLARGVGAGRDCTLWWIDLRLLPGAAATIVELLAAGAFSVLALGATSAWLRRAAGAVLLVFAAIAAGNCVQYVRVVHGGRVAPGLPVPFSLLVGMALTWAGWRAAFGTPKTDVAPRRRGPARRRVAFACGFLATATGLPLAQMLFFGTTDYRRPADAIIVLGAGVDADGRPSLALYDRVETACRLYHEGRAPLLIFSGGPGPAPGARETDAMRDLALRRGVPGTAILLDRDGVTTDATVRNTTAVLSERKLGRVLVVSHGYHLPRVKLAYRAAGREVYTVPAEQSRGLVRMPYYVAREVAALWVYYGRGLVRP